jgi:pyridinium-3,5-biscarboxylic acid mononucleotide sulfurtransferase
MSHMDDSVYSGHAPIDSQSKRDALLEVLRHMGSAAVALSGGIDSTVVAKAANIALGTHAVAVTADSPSVARDELEAAARAADLIGIRHIVIKTDELDDPNYVRNDGSRCYYCKSELYGRIANLLPTLGARFICSGANLDDLGDYRPGLTAALEHHVRHPLVEAGCGKADVRLLARHWSLPTWDKPAAPCLSSRLAPGVSVTEERLAIIEAAEQALHRLGFRECRVRLHPDNLARIEVPADEVKVLLDDTVRERLLGQFRELGFRFVTIDLEGFRSGSLNSLVNLETRARFTPR